MSSEINLLAEYQRRIAQRVTEMRDDMLAMACYPMHIAKAGEVIELRGLRPFGREIPAPIREHRRYPRACACCGAPYETLCSYCGRVDYNHPDARKPTVIVPGQEMNESGGFKFEPRAVWELERGKQAEAIQWFEDTLEVAFPDGATRVMAVTNRAVMNATGCGMMLTGVEI